MKPASTFWHIVSMAFLFLIEVPLSYAAFSPFGLPAFMQLILAVGVGLIFAFMGHRLGALLKEGAFRTVQNTVWIIFCIAIPIFAMFGISYMREAYAASLMKSTNITNAITPGLPIVELNHNAVLLAFFFINVMLYGVAVLLSMRLHDTLVLAAADLKQAQERLHDAERRLRQIVSSRIKRAYRYFGYVKGVIQQHECLVSVYKRKNLQARDISAERQASADPKRGQPLSFLTSIDVEIPKCWQDPEKELKW